MHTNVHGYVSKYITYEKACVMDDGLEKLLKDYRLNQCLSIIQHQSVVVIALKVSSYCNSSYSIYNNNNSAIPIQCRK